VRGPRFEGPSNKPDEADDADCTDACKLQFMSTAQTTGAEGPPFTPFFRRGGFVRRRRCGICPLRKLTICNSGADVSAVPAVKFIQCRKIKTLVLSHSLAPTETGIGIETEIEIERGGLDVTTKLVVQLLARQIALAQSPVFLLSSSWLLFLVSYFLSLLVFPPPVFQYLFFF